MLVTISVCSMDWKDLWFERDPWALAMCSPHCLGWAGLGWAGQAGGDDMDHLIQGLGRVRWSAPCTLQLLRA